MNGPSVITMVLHLGVLIGTGKDVFKGVQDLIDGHPSPDDLKAVLKDVVDLVNGGLINIPSITGDQLASVVADIEKVLGI